MKSNSSVVTYAMAIFIAGMLAAGSSYADKPGKGHGNGNGNGNGQERHGNQGDQNEHGGNGGSGKQGHSGKDDGHFGSNQRVLVREYYVTANAGHCPPGLAKKHNGCMPPGQAKKWNVGRTLPRDVVYYPVPTALVTQLGQPPAGHKYVRVAADILMIAIGSGMVVDAIQDLGRV